MARILVSGDRDWIDKDTIRRCFACLDRFPGQITLIHGDCRGLDRTAGEVAREKGWQVIAVPADWNQHGKAAGPIRNKEMLDMNPDLLIWFHDDLGRSRGTSDMIRQATGRGLKIINGTSYHQVV